MNILQKIVVLVWGLLVSLKFRNIPKYVELENVKLKVTEADGYKSMQHFNDYGAIIPDIIIYTVIAIVLYIVFYKVNIKLNFKGIKIKRKIKTTQEPIKNNNNSSNKYLFALSYLFKYGIVVTVFYIGFIINGVDKNKTTWFFDNTYYVYEDVFNYTFFYLLILIIIYILSVFYLETNENNKKGSN